MPLSKMSAWLACAAATPKMRLEIDTMPSFAPSTLARSQDNAPSLWRSWARRVVGGFLSLTLTIMSQFNVLPNILTAASHNPEFLIAATVAMRAQHGYSVRSK
jgi:hypothetical protein